MVTIKKVKYVQEKLTIVYSDSERQERVTLEAREAPSPELLTALKNIGYIQHYLPLNNEVETVKVTSVSFKTDDGIYEGVQAGISIKIKEQNRPWNSTTPLYELDEYETLQEFVDELIKQTKDYIAGKRQQGDLFVGAEEDGGTWDGYDEGVYDEENMEYDNPDSK